MANLPNLDPFSTKRTIHWRIAGEISFNLLAFSPNSA